MNAKRDTSVPVFLLGGLLGMFLAWGGDEIAHWTRDQQVADRAYTKALTDSLSSPWKAWEEPEWRAVGAPSDASVGTKCWIYKGTTPVCVGS